MASNTPAIRTPIGILSYPHLFVPKPPAEGAEPRFSLVLVFPEETVRSPEFQALKKAAAAAVKERWGDKAPANLRNPFRKCSEKEGSPFDDHPNGIFISAWTKVAPGIVGPRLEELIDPADVFAGQLARCTVRPFAYEAAGNKGVSFGLNNIQIVKPDMDRLDGRKPARNDFDAVDEPEAVAAGGDDADEPF
jgi:hypothetical protein